MTPKQLEKAAEKYYRMALQVRHIDAPRLVSHDSILAPAIQDAFKALRALGQLCDTLAGNSPGLQP